MSASTLRTSHRNFRPSFLAVPTTKIPSLYWSTLLLIFESESPNVFLMWTNLVSRFPFGPTLVWLRYRFGFSVGLARFWLLAFGSTLMAARQLSSLTCSLMWHWAWNAVVLRRSWIGSAQIGGIDKWYGTRFWLIRFWFSLKELVLVHNLNTREAQQISHCIHLPPEAKLPYPYTIILTSPHMPQTVYTYKS